MTLVYLLLGLGCFAVLLGLTNLVADKEIQGDR